jgi:tRNA(Arg) A34 adenosine deaminase TadA
MSAGTSLIHNQVKGKFADMPAITTMPGRRNFFRSLSFLLSTPLLGAVDQALAMPSAAPTDIDPAGTPTRLDADRMRALADWTMLTMATANPVPYGAEIFDNKTGVSLMRAANAVGPEHDPSAHGEIRTIRLACQKLQSGSLRGYTLYTTCEPCPMCMACCLWAGLDRVVYGATIADAARFGHQIMISAADVQRHSDLPCSVVGPVEREHCLTLFTNPRMQERFKKWQSGGHG